MKVALFLGSVRQKNKTAEAGKLISRILADKKHSAAVLNPAEIKVTSLGAEFDDLTIKSIRKMVNDADAVILCTPEYHGNFSSTLMALLENLDYPSVLAGKPVALVGVAAGKMGATKSLEHLRSVAAHCGAFVLPRVTSIAHSFQTLGTDGTCSDPTVEPWLESMIDELDDLAVRLK